MNIIPMRDLKDTVAIEKMCSESNEPVFVTKNGYGKLVVMDIAYFEKTMQKVYEAKLIHAGLQDLQQGNVSDATSALREIKEKYGF